MIDVRISDRNGVLVHAFSTNDPAVIEERVKDWQVRFRQHEPDALPLKVERSDEESTS